MNWKTFFIKFLRNVAIGIIMGVVILGGIGFHLSGWEGLVNMAYWGVALGLIGGFSSGFGMIVQANFWGKGNYQIYPEWNWFIKKSKDDEPYDY